jgi:hypothetical protein
MAFDSKDYDEAEHVQMQTNKSGVVFKYLMEAD